MDPSDSIDSTPPSSSRSTSNSRIPSFNPYQRMASRRAIACVTCAKAKTKCDKGLPSCSRCISKGIKCDPRSTRRTSDHSYRTNIRKPFVSPKRYHPSSNMPSLSLHSSPRSMPSSDRPRIMRPASHIDFRTAVKMSQQASAGSAFPILTPLPTYTSQVVDECYSYSSPPAQDMNVYTPPMEYNCMPTSSPLTPPAPECNLYHEPLAIGDMSTTWMASQAWSDDSLAPTGLGFQGDMTALLPPEMWSMHEYAHSAPITQIPWAQPSPSASPQSMASDLMSYAGPASSLSISECSMEGFNNAGAFPEHWTNCQPTTTQFDMTSMMTSVPFMHSLQSISSTVPVWEDVFMPSSAPY